MYPQNDVPQIDVHDIYEKWKQGEISLVDVREQSEYDLGHIEGIALIPLYQLQWRWRDLDKSRKWVFVCRMGERSYYAATLMKQAGLDAANMEGGMLAWKYEGLPITDPGIVEAH